MADLLTLAALKDYLGLPAATDVPLDTRLQQLLDDAESLFERECGRTRFPFAAAGARTQVFDGTGTGELFLAYPIATLTSVTLGHDLTAPDETLDVADPLQLAFGVGERRLVRIDGGIFGCAHVPRYVQVVYGAAADLPGGVRLALERVVAALFRQIGGEDATRESAPDYSRDLVQIAAGDATWQIAVLQETRSVVG